MDQPTQQEDDDDGDHRTDEGKEGDGRRVVMGTFGVEPLVVDALQLTRLLQTGIGVVDGFDERLVIADDTQFSCGNVDVVEQQTVESVLPDLHLQRHLTPDIIGVMPVANGCQSLSRRTVFRMIGFVLDLLDAQRHIVVVLHHQGVLGGEFVEPLDCLLTLSSDQLYGIVVDHVLRHHIRVLSVVDGQGVDEICLPVLKGLGTEIPLLHHIFMGHLQGVQDEVEHLHVIAICLTVVIAELIGWELPVAHNDKGTFFGIFTHPLRLCRQQTAEHQTGE